MFYRCILFIQRRCKIFTQRDKRPGRMPPAELDWPGCFRTGKMWDFQFMIGRETISRTLILIFFLPGLAQLLCEASAECHVVSQNTNMEFRTRTFSNSLPAENSFGENRWVAQFDGEPNDDDGKYVLDGLLTIQPRTVVLPIPNGALAKGSRFSSMEIFLANCQFLI